ncbi:hypothetical protein ACFY3G_29150 [Streptomyces phaeochromogenes]|uniref:hypothetical protein n=1 Tax=Streptomyces phaeochromogenes TaxID=1923 RepID=UPI00369A900D
MIADSCVLSLPKSQLDPSQIEDAAAILLPPAGVRSEARLVVADGSSGSAGSGWWADRLARALRAAPGRSFHSGDALAAVAADAALGWPSHRRDLVAHASVGPRAWLARVRTDKSPAATLLGLRLLPAPPPSGHTGIVDEGKWEAVAVGDSCMFQVRADLVVASEYCQKRVPQVIRASSDDPVQPPNFQHGLWRDRDVFYLMTDALARWWARRADEGTRPWLLLDEVCSTPEDFTAWVRTQRSNRTLQDDDITLLRAECGPW